MTRFYANLLIAMILLTFVGQTVASVVRVCDMPHVTTASMQHADMASDHNMDEMDCCHEEGNNSHDCGCPVSACSVHSLLPIDSLVVHRVKQSERVQQLSNSLLIYYPRSLYRPPITA
ncbi:hypothetical protein [Pseudoalteromonas mariniglutinosa]|uniref:hypothetical protein n=1 Tax=Pseudoalteromonas mariniglutinosa TaxID=206042 RepID=UPI00384B8AF2